MMKSMAILLTLAAAGVQAAAPYERLLGAGTDGNWLTYSGSYRSERFLPLGEFPRLARGTAQPHVTTLEHLVGRHQATGTDHGSRLDHGTIEHGRSHAYETEVLNRTGMQGDIVPHRDIVTDIETAAAGGEFTIMGDV